MVKALYALSGDPITYGHLHVIERGVELFDHLTVAFAINGDKHYTFTLEERMEMLAQALHFHEKITMIDIKPTEFVARVARDQGIPCLLRGVRDAKDLLYEMKMANFNSKHFSSVQTVWIPTPPNLADVSSSHVKGLVGLEDWKIMVQDLVPPYVLECLDHWNHDRQRENYINKANDSSRKKFAETHNGET